MRVTNDLGDLKAQLVYPPTTIIIAPSNYNDPAQDMWVS
jgi:hypothetical protein